jgi:hypothetical protein
MPAAPTAVSLAVPARKPTAHQITAMLAKRVHTAERVVLRCAVEFVRSDVGDSLALADAVLDYQMLAELLVQAMGTAADPSA